MLGRSDDHRLKGSETDDIEYCSSADGTDRGRRAVGLAACRGHAAAPARATPSPAVLRPRHRSGLGADVALRRHRGRGPRARRLRHRRPRPVLRDRAARRRRGGAGAAQRVPPPGRAPPQRPRGIGRQHRVRLPPVDLRHRRVAAARRRPGAGLRQELLRPASPSTSASSPGWSSSAWPTTPRTTSTRWPPRCRRTCSPTSCAAPRWLRRSTWSRTANWKLVMENNRECYHCEAGHPELMQTFFPTYGYEPDEIPARLRPAHERYLQAEAALERGLRAAWPPVRRRSRSSTPASVGVPGPARGPRRRGGVLHHRRHAPPRAALLGDLDTPRLGRRHDAHPAQRVVPPARRPRGHVRDLPDRGGPDPAAHHLAGRTRTPRRASTTTSPTSPTCGARPTSRTPRLCARAHQGVSSPAYEPGPYAPQRVPGRRAHQLVRRPGARPPRPMTSAPVRPRRPRPWRSLDLLTGARRSTSRWSVSAYGTRPTTS